MGAKSADFDVVTKKIRVATHVVWLARKELLLEIETRPPGEAATDLDIFAHDMPKHVFG